MYIEIDGNQYPCEVKTSITQLGNTVIRVTSEEAPVAENGFVLISGDNTFDRSSFKYLYRMDGNVKEYTEVEEEIIPASGYISGIPESPIDRRFDAVNQRISEVTPYEQTKMAYFGEVEKVFYGVPSGVLTVHMDNEYTVDRVADRVIVKFDRLSGTKEITIVVQ